MSSGEEVLDNAHHILYVNPYLFDQNTFLLLPMPDTPHFGLEAMGKSVNLGCVHATRDTIHKVIHNSYRHDGLISEGYAF